MNESYPAILAMLNEASDIDSNLGAEKCTSPIGPNCWVSKGDCENFFETKASARCPNTLDLCRLVLAIC